MNRYPELGKSKCLMTAMNKTMSEANVDEEVELLYCS